MIQVVMVVMMQVVMMMMMIQVVVMVMMIQVVIMMVMMVVLLVMMQVVLMMIRQVIYHRTNYHSALSTLTTVTIKQICHTVHVSVFNGASFIHPPSTLRP